MGKTRERFIQEGIQKYLRYLKPYMGIEMQELNAEKITDLKDAPTVRKKEAKKIFKSLPAGTFLAALDERGEEFTSHEFARFLDGVMQSGVREAVFVIGGAMGLDEQVTGCAKKVIAMSRWTLTHEMARLVLLEQLYRAFTILKGKPYHY
jgi:23S rRNA (pseudouridine1915-N3)-methyltransferase